MAHQPLAKTMDTVLDTLTSNVMVKDETVNIYIKGTYSMIIQLQREVRSFGSGSWEILKSWSTANATVDYTHTAKRDGERVRLFLQTDTSGTAYASMVDEDKSMVVKKDISGQTIWEASQEEFKIPAGRNIADIPRGKFDSMDMSKVCTIVKDDFIVNASEAIDAVSGWYSRKGSGANTADLTLVADQANGTGTLKSSDANVSDAADTSRLVMDDLHCFANKGGLTIEVGMAVDVITDLWMFIGFSDDNATQERTMDIASNVIVATAENACGIIFDTAATLDFLRHGGVKATTVTLDAVSATAAPVAATQHVYRVEVDVAGGVQGFFDGVALGPKIANAVTITTALTPEIAVANLTTSARILTIDYVHVWQNR